MGIRFLCYVSVVLCYGLYVPGFDFGQGQLILLFSKNVQTGSGAHPAPYSVDDRGGGGGGLFRGVRGGGGGGVKEAFITRGALCAVFLTKYYSCCQIKKNEMDWACSMHGEGIGAYRDYMGKLEGWTHLEDLGVDGRTLKQILKKWDGRAWTGFIWLRIGTHGGL